MEPANPGAVDRKPHSWKRVACWLILFKTTYLAVVLAAVGIGWIGFKGRWELLLPVVLLATVLAVHAWHRPYWYYYGLHFAIPLAWLGAVGATHRDGVVGVSRALSA